MNPEIENIIQELEKYTPPPDYRNENNKAAVQNFVSIRMARVVFLIAKDVGASAEKISAQTEKLIEFSDAQKKLAEESSKQSLILSEETKRLVHETLILSKFTKSIRTLTIVLVAFGYVQIIITVFEYCSGMH